MGRIHPESLICLGRGLSVYIVAPAVYAAPHTLNSGKTGSIRGFGRPHERQTISVRLLVPLFLLFVALLLLLILPFL
jgi:hypothetical protein